MILGNEGEGNLKEKNSFSFFVSPSEQEKKLVAKESSALSFAMASAFFLSYFLQTMFTGLGSLINKDLIYSAFFSEITVLVSYAVSMSVPFYLFAACTKIPPGRALRVRRTDMKLTFACLCVALGVSVVGMFSSAALGFVLSRLGIVFRSPASYIPYETASFVIYILNLTAVPAVLEEMAFRGFVMQPLRRFGDGFALFASSFCFALFHIDPTRFPHTFIMGLVIGYFVLFTGSLTTGIMIHFVYNSVIAAISLSSEMGFAHSAVFTVAMEIAMLSVSLPGLFYLIKNYSGMFALRKGRGVNPQSVNIGVFLKSKGMIVLYALILLLSFKNLVL